MSPLIAYALGSLLIIGMIVVGDACERLFHTAINYKRRQREMSASCIRERIRLSQRDMIMTDTPRIA